MGSFSVSHWLIVLAIIVLLFGAKKIPELAKGVGKGIKSFKKEMEDDSPVQNVEKTDEITSKTAQNQQNSQNETAKSV